MRFAVALTAFLVSLPAFALEGMTFYLRNMQDRAIVLEFRGRTTGTVWPGGDDVYLLTAKEKKSVLLGCREGEEICYGAWVKGNDRISFGVGPDDDQTCEDCCRICVAKTTEQIDIGGSFQLK